MSTPATERAEHAAHPAGRTDTERTAARTVAELATDVLRMHPVIAQSWNLWSPIVGRTASTRIEHIWEDFPELTSAIVSTADGLTICALGMNEEDAGRLAALNSSLFGVARAETRIMSPGSDTDAALFETAGSDPGGNALVARTSVAISFGDTQTAVFSFVVEPFGQLLLGMSARQVQLGTLMVQARAAARSISLALGQSAPQL